MPVTTAFPSSRVARGSAIKESYDPNIGAAGTRFRPTRISVVGQGENGVTYATTKRRVYSAYEAGSVYGFKSPLYLAAASLFKQGYDVGDIPVTLYPLAQPASGGVAASGSVTPTGSGTEQQSYWFKINNVLSREIVTEVSDAVADFCDKAVVAINAVLGMPGTATDGTTAVNFSVGWQGASGNHATDGVTIEVIGPDDPDFTFVIVQPANGAGTVATADAITALGGDVWESHVINCLESTNSTALTAFAALGESRSASEVKKPLRVFTGTKASVAAMSAITDAMSTDRTNVFCPNPSSNDLGCVIAATWVREIAKIENADPASDYGNAKLVGLTPGSTVTEFASSLRQATVLMGCSTADVKNDILVISDTVTTYHPTGEEPPGYRYVCDFAKTSTMIYNVDLMVENGGWASGSPLVPDSQSVRNPNAKKPKMFLAQLFGVFDNAADDAIISDPDYAKENSSAGINSTNAKRLDAKVVFKLSGNGNVVSIDMSWGFYYER
jgi:phage tail sheath gpL-like